MFPTLESECLIVGGGPAGSLLGATLARWGRRVVLVERGGHVRPMPEETLVPSAEALLARHGLLELVRREGFQGTRKQGSIWGGEEPRWRDVSGDGRGFKVVRKVFDRELRRLAASHGARILAGSVAGPIEAGRGVRARLDDGRELVLEAPVVVAATGSRTAGGLVPHKVERELPATIALSARTPGGDDTTLIEAVPEGWIWWLPLRAGEVSVTLFADRDELRARGHDALWSSALANALGPARGCLAQSPRGTDATPRLRRSLGEVLLVGDAASTIDPLSSQGIEKALASAEAVAYAANTILAHPERAARVRENHWAWERGLFGAHERETRAFYDREQRFAECPFWSRRRRAAAERTVLVPQLPECVVRNPRLEEVPKLERRDRLLVEVAGFRLAGEAEVLDRVGAVAIAPLLELLEERPTTAEAVDLAARHPGLVTLSPRVVTQALGELYRKGFLVAL